MFTQKKKQYYSNILGFKNSDDFESFAKRYLKYLQNQPLTKNRIMSGFFILLEIQKETISKNKTLINLENKCLMFSIWFKYFSENMLITIIPQIPTTYLARE